MKRKALMIIAILGLLVLGLAAVAAADSSNRPFKGSLSGEVTFNFVGQEVCPTSDLLYGDLASDSTARGNASHMGRVQMVSRHCTPAGEAVTGGFMTLTAANGDDVFIQYDGTAPFPIPGVTEYVDVELDFSITGGTGRFADATGGGEMNAQIEFLGFGVMTWPATWDWTGTIGY